MNSDTECEGNNDIYDVCIVGMGIGGLAAALALQNCGFKIFVAEKDDYFSDRKQGYGLTLTNSTSGPLAKLGLLDQCVRENCPSHSHFIFNGQGDILGYYGRAVTNKLPSYWKRQKVGGPCGDNGSEHEHEQFGGNRGNLRIPRQGLREMMLSRLRPEVLHWGHKFTDASATADYAIIQFHRKLTNTSVSVKARILLGADGIHSLIRQYRDTLLSTKFPKVAASKLSPLQYLGVSVLLGISECDHPLLCDRGFYVIDGHHRLFTMPFYTAASSPSSSSSSTVLATNELLSIVGHSETKNNQSDVDHSDNHINHNNKYNSHLNNRHNEVSQRQIMWQLSFANTDELWISAFKSVAVNNTLTANPVSPLLDAALQKTHDYFPAVKALLMSSKEVWGTNLYDRETMHLFPFHTMIQQYSSSTTSTAKDCIAALHLLSRLTVLGDACHPMSMFKGQGANQALEDAVLFAKKLSELVPLEEATNLSSMNPLFSYNHKKRKGLLHMKMNKKRKDEVEDYLSNAPQLHVCLEEKETTNTEPTSKNKSIVPEISINPHPEDLIFEQKSNSTQFFQQISLTSLSTQLRSFEREMIQRAFPKVLMSREAAQFYHSPEKVLNRRFGIHGVDDIEKKLQQTDKEVVDLVQQVLEEFKYQQINAYYYENHSKTAADDVTGSSMMPPVTLEDAMSELIVAKYLL
jgi:2-polyprenyl-6-methoxyphenol hydroxylase-like FAD-dependent oxidoreductase